MRLAVDLNDEVYNNMVVKNEYTDRDIIAAHNALMGAMRIPEGHGRLIDADVLCDYFWDNRSKLYTHKDLQIVIDNAPTIIEADKGEQE